MPVKKSDLSYLRDVVNGDVALDTENPPLFSRLFRWYETHGVDFYGSNPDENYAILIDHLALDIGFGWDLIQPGGASCTTDPFDPRKGVFLCV